MEKNLFRGKSILDGTWHEGSLLVFPSGRTKILKQNQADLEFDQIEVDPKTVGQYTGEVDKNGKKIFEGDIVTMQAYHGGRIKAIVYFKKGKFAVDGSNYAFKDLAPKTYEIISNIYDDLLNN